MDKRALTALLSSAVSELLLLLLHAISPSAGDTFSHPSPLLIHLISISQTTAAISLLSNKRKRSHSPEPYSPTKLRRTIPNTPDSFNLLFNITSSTFEWLSSLLEPLLECRDPVNSPLNLPVETRLSIGLFRLTTASDYLQISRRFNVSVPVAKFCVSQFCRVLCTNFRFWVGFPTRPELDPITKSFETLTGLPNCCGVIHCTRFMIPKHGSIAAQIVTDSSSKILNIVAGLNGKKSNHKILKSSTIYNDIESNRMLNSPPIHINDVSIPQYLIGDRGYSVLPWLMVPFEQNPVANSNSDEERFNSACDSMMVSAFRTVDSLKKWGVLSKPFEGEMKTIVAYIGACSILHNALLTREDYSCLSDKCDEDLWFSLGRKEGIDDVNVGLKDDLVVQKGFEIRNALATRARRC